jgi:type I restriction enzyme S subunit
MDGEFRVARWAGQEALLNQRVCTIRVRESAILDERFLFLALPGYLAAINERTSSVTVKHLSSKTILDIPLPLPPMAEQQRIVEIIEEQFSRLDGAVAALEAARRRVEAGISSCFQAHFVDPSKSVQLAHVAEVVGGLAKDSAKQAVDGLVEVPYLRVANVQRGYLDLSDIATIRTTEAKVNNLKLLPGDVLFNEGGDRDKLGRGWVWDGQISICIHQNHVFRARLDTERYLPRFVSHYANTVGRKWFEARGKQTTNLASLNLTTLKSFDLPVLDIEEQRRIVTVVEDTLFIYERLSSALKICEAKQKQLRKAILSSALSGRLMRRFQQPSVPGDARWIAVPQGTAAIEL